MEITPPAFLFCIIPPSKWMRSYGSCPLPLLYHHKNLVSSVDRDQIPKMSQSVTIDFADTTCSLCHCKDQTFLHNVLKGGEACKICPSCVLFEHIELYCPECFDLHDGTGALICCRACKSNTHRKCLSDEVDINKFRCATCEHPQRLIFDWKESREDNVSRKLVDIQAARLLLTSASVVHEVMSKAHEKWVNSAMMRVNEA